jgi:prolipoprotein diacylglyceryltransferase
MYPDLSYLFHDWFGTEPDNALSIFKMFGLMLVLAIFTAAWFLYMEFKRKANEGQLKPQKVKTTVGAGASTSELISNGFFGFLLGFKGLYIALNFAEFQNDPAGLVFSGKGNIVAGLLFAAAFAGFRYWEKNKKKLPQPKEVIETVWPHDRIGDITVVAAVSGIIGAKVFAILESAEAIQSFFSDPIGTFLSGSGLAIYGGLIGGYIGLSWYLKKLDIPFLVFGDAVAPAMMFAYGVGRIGCQLAGDGDWGIDAAIQPDWWFLPDWTWSYNYPHNVNNAGVLMEQCDSLQYKELFGRMMSPEQRCLETCGIKYCHELDPKVYPTPFYETVVSFLMGGFLWAIRKRVTIAGMLFFLYLLLNGLERFFIEKIRVNDKIHLGSLDVTQAEIIATCLMLIGIGGMVWLYRKGKRG